MFLTIHRPLRYLTFVVFFTQKGCTMSHLVVFITCYFLCIVISNTQLFIERYYFPCISCLQKIIISRRSLFLAFREPTSRKCLVREYVLESLLVITLAVFSTYYYLLFLIHYPVYSLYTDPCIIMLLFYAHYYISYIILYVL